MAGNINLEENGQHFSDIKGTRVRVDSEKDTFIFRSGAEN